MVDLALSDGIRTFETKWSWTSMMLPNGLSKCGITESKLTSKPSARSLLGSTLDVSSETTCLWLHLCIQMAFSQLNSKTEPSLLICPPSVLLSYVSVLFVAFFSCRPASPSEQYTPDLHDEHRNGASASPRFYKNDLFFE